MTNKKFKLAAMSLATAVAVSTVGPSASAVTYYLGDGSVTVDKDVDRGAYSYQGEDGSEEHRTYVNEDKVQRKPHRRILPQILLPTTQRTAPRLRPHLETPSRSKKM